MNHITLSTFIIFAFACSFTACTGNSSSSAELDAVPSEAIEYYRILLPRGDTATSLASNCEWSDTSITCEKLDISCAKDYVIPVYATNSQKNTKVVYKELNFGPNKLTSHIPYANIPEFDTTSIKEMFASIDNSPCSIAKKFTSNYEIKASGLPENVLISEYTVFYDKYNIIKPEISLKETEVSQSNDSIMTISITKTTTCLIGGKIADPSPEKCDSDPQVFIPEKIKEHSYKLIIKSTYLPDTTITWKLEYKDQYGRGGSMSITSKFATNK